MGLKLHHLCIIQQDKKGEKVGVISLAKWFGGGGKALDSKFTSLKKDKDLLAN